MPIVHSLEKTMVNRITEYYGNASIFRPNKFLVGLYGEYVGLAVDKLRSDSEIERYATALYNGNQKVAFNTKIYKNALSRWLDRYYFTDERQVELKWTCADVKIPTIKTKTENNGLRMDNHKSIKHPLIQHAESNGTIDLTIIEDRNLMMYQFFNALMNQFFIPQILKPRSSFHKMGMYIAILQEDYVLPTAMTEGGYKRDADLESAVAQIFEFNAIVPKSIGDISLSNNAEGKLTYKVTFEAPNIFQGSFKTSFKGLSNTASDPTYINSAIDQTFLNKKNEYQRGRFEISKNELKTQGNGVYPF